MERELSRDKRSSFFRNVEADYQQAKRELTENRKWILRKMSSVNPYLIRGWIPPGLTGTASRRDS